MSQQSTRTAQSRKRRRRRFGKFIVILLAAIAVFCTLDLLIMPKSGNFHSSRIKLKPPTKIVQGLLPNNKNSSTATAQNGVNLNNQLQDAWKPILQQASSQAGIAIYSNKTKQTYTAQNTTSDYRFRMASTIKVTILVGLLIKEGSLNSNQQAEAQTMIENSSNDAASALYVDLGEKDGLQNAFNQLGMTDSTAHDEWGLSTTTPSDQLKLLNNIFFSSQTLNSTQQQYVRNLMQSVENDQQWGISSGSDNFALKNGWLDQDDGWIVNSIGYIPGANGQSDGYTIAVYTDSNNTMQDGENLIGKLAKATKKVINTQN